MKTVLLFCIAAVLLLAILILNPQWSVAVNIFGVFVSLGLFALAWLFAASNVARMRQEGLRKHQFDNVTYIRTMQGALIRAGEEDQPFASRQSVRRPDGLV